MMTLKGVFPDAKPNSGKNFIRENVKNIRRISSSNDKDKKAEGGTKIFDDKEKRDKRHASANVLFSKSEVVQKRGNRDSCQLKQTKRDCQIKGFSKSTQDLLKTCSDLNIRHVKKRNLSSLSRKNVTYISRGIQTSFSNDVSEEETGSNPGSSRKNVEETKVNVETSGKQNESSKKEKEESARQHKDYDKSNSDEKNKEKSICSQISDKDQVTECELNIPHLSHSATIVTERETERSQSKSTKSASPPKSKSIPKHRLGVVPKYLLERKEELLREKQEKEAELLQPLCPEGHILLPDQERKETLTMLKKSYQDCINELNRLPIRSDTLRAHQKKMELEKKLNKMEEGIKVFSRPKVFVKVNSCSSKE